MATAMSCTLPSSPCFCHHNLTQCLMNAVRWVDAARMHLREHPSGPFNDDYRRNALVIRQSLEAALVFYRTSRQRTSVQFFTIALQLASGANGILRTLSISQLPVTEESSLPPKCFREEVLKWFSHALTGLEKKLGSVYTSEDIADLFVEKMWSTPHCSSCRDRKMARFGMPNKEEQVKFLAACFLQECVDVKLRGEDDVLLDPSRDLDAFLDVCRTQGLLLESERNPEPDVTSWCQNVVELMRKPETASVEPRTSRMEKGTAKLPKATLPVRVPQPKKVSLCCRRSGVKRTGHPLLSPANNAGILPQSCLLPGLETPHFGDLSSYEKQKLPLPSGISFTKRSQRFSAATQSRGVRFRKSFQVSRYGHEGALRLAIDALKQMHAFHKGK